MEIQQITQQWQSRVLRLSCLLLSPVYLKHSHQQKPIINCSDGISKESYSHVQDWPDQCLFFLGLHCLYPSI